MKGRIVSGKENEELRAKRLTEEADKKGRTSGSKRGGKASGGKRRGAQQSLKSIKRSLRK